MSILPASIESYLEEAGFSATEILVIKKLLEEDALTLREIAAKTGKSTGVLDQAVKKLLKKGILSREAINDTHKFVLKSLNTVVTWMEDDMHLRQDLMVRRHQDFETFVRSLTLIKNRPEMEYFEGTEGIKKAYMKLLSRGNDIIQYGPTLYLAEEDPLREFRVQWFRERRSHGIFLRAITNDTVLGRRFQSRDPFEYRKTILLDANAYPFNFEKIIIGDTVACFHTDQGRACFIKFPELAAEERVFFERLWNKKIHNSNNVVSETELDPSVSKPVIDVTIPFSTKTLSQVREFFLSRRSIGMLAVFGVLAASLTYGIYVRDKSFNAKRVQERALSIAATGALQFDPEELNELRTSADIHKPEYSKVISQLNLIRTQNPGMKYAYIMRPTKDPLFFEFVADADSIDPFAKIDLDFNGEIDQADSLTPRGTAYDATNVPEMRNVLKGMPTVDATPHADQWGVFISGYGPIKNALGETVALLAVVIEASAVETLSRNMFVLGLIFTSLFIILIAIRLMAFNKSLLNELSEIIKPSRTLLIATAGFIIVILLSIFFYRQDVKLGLEEARAKIVAIATTGALQFSSADLDNLHAIQDISKSTYQEIVHKLHEIRLGNKKIQYVYLIRPFPNTTTFEFIADADGFERNLKVENDIDGNGVFDPSDEVGYPGLMYDVSHIDILSKGLYFSPVSTSKPYTDKWGTSLSGYAPIKNQSGDIAGLLAIDIDASEIYSPKIEVFFPIIIYGMFILIYIFIPDLKFTNFCRNDISPGI